MSLPLDLLFGQVAKAIQSHSAPNTPGPSYNANPLLGALQGVFGQFAGQSGSQFNRQPDYDDGEEFNQQYGNVLPASQDPHGDPADQAQGQFTNQGQFTDQGQFGNVLPASQDPYGDPADQR